MASPTLTQEKVLENVDKLVSTIVNFPSVVHEAGAMGLINRVEMQTILSAYSTPSHKLTTLFLLITSKECSSLPKLLTLTGNEDALQALLQENDQGPGAGPILDNLDKLISHTENCGAVLSYATGLGLINGWERELMNKQCKSEEEELSAFYNLVASKSNGLDNLLQVLRMTNNHWALQVLHCDNDE